MPNQPISGTLEIQDSTAQAKVTITLDGNTADIILGLNDERLRLGAIQDIATPGKAKPGAGPPQTPGQPVSQYWGLRASNAEGSNRIELAVNSEVPEVPRLVLRNLFGKEMVHISVQSPGGLAPEVPRIVLNNPIGKNEETVSLTGNGEITLGGGQSDGVITIRTNSGEDRISLNAHDGHIGILSKGFTVPFFDVVSLDGRADSSSVRLRVVKSGDPFPTAFDRIRLEAKEGGMWLGGNGADSTIVLFDQNGDNSTMSKASIVIDGAKGDIFLQNADCAEEFELAGAVDVEPGTVMVIEEDGRLRPSDRAYDRRVAGVISGAGGCKPGITLDRKPYQDNRMPVALVGKVFCKVDAQYSAVEVGDLLTTSATPGHAMKAIDPFKAFGAVLGKALMSIESGTGMIAVLAGLQ